MADRVATGIDVLDRKLAGGLPPGTIVAYTARPASQSELLLYQLTAARRTLYLSTQRSAEAVSHAMERRRHRSALPASDGWTTRRWRRRANSSRPSPRTRT